MVTQSKKIVGIRAAWLGLAAVALGGLASVHAGTVSFSAPTTFPTDRRSNSVVTADFNKDGKLDLAVTNFGSDNVAVLLGNGAGSFGAATFIGVGRKPSSVVTADFDGDSNLDLAVANYGEGGLAATLGTVSILLGNGLGSFVTAVTPGVGINPNFIATGDFNGDNRLDLATANFGSDNVSVLLANGLPSLFGNASHFAVPAHGRSIAVGDLTGDGKLDLAVANFTDELPPFPEFVSILPGNGAGSFGAPTNLALFKPHFVGIGDFNRDSKPDLVVADRRDVVVLLGNGLGGFGAPFTFSVGAAPIYVAMGDFNLDGKTDLAAANDGSGDISVLTANGLILFEPAVHFAVGNTPLWIAPGDFNGDGKLDLAVANWGSDNVSILLSTTIPCPTITLSNTLPDGTLGSPYNQTITASGGTAPYSFAVIDGALPPGVALSSTGTLSGTPTAIGTFNFAVRATDANNCTGSKAYSLTINCAAITLSPGALPDGSVGAFYSQAITASGGAAPYTFSVPPGALPAGLALSAGGVLSGTPTGPALAAFTITATDAKGCAGSRNYTLVIISGPRGIKESLLGDILALRATVTNRQDGNTLDQVITHLRKSLDPALWIDQRHLQPRGGTTVFTEEKNAAIKLEDLMKDRRSTIPAATLQGFLNRIVAADRELARIVVEEAIAATGDPKSIAQAVDELAKGDSDVAGAMYSSGIEHYHKAWNHALRARGL